MEPILYADFNNADSKGRVRLNCHGTLEDIHSKSVELREGLKVHLSDGELAVKGVVQKLPDALANREPAEPQLRWRTNLTRGTSNGVSARAARSNSQIESAHENPSPTRQAR